MILRWFRKINNGSKTAYNQHCVDNNIILHYNILIVLKTIPSQ